MLRSLKGIWGLRNSKLIIEFPACDDIIDFFLFKCFIDFYRLRSVYPYFQVRSLIYDHKSSCLKDAKYIPTFFQIDLISGLLMSTVCIKMFLRPTYRFQGELAYCSLGKPLRTDFTQRMLVCTQ